MTRVFKSKKLLGVLFLALILIAGGIFMVVGIRHDASTRKVSAVVASKDVKQGLTEGKCNAAAMASLSTVDENAEAAAKGKAYEAQGLCFTYASDYSSALESYKKSQTAFKEAKLDDDSKRVGISINTSEYLINAAKAVKLNQEHPIDDSQEPGGS
jgi:hypothetical protein